MNAIALVAQPSAFWPERGPATTFCILLGTIDFGLIAFIVSRLL